jgi:hypothetical protein
MPALHATCRPSGADSVDDTLEHDMKPSRYAPTLLAATISLLFSAGASAQARRQPQRPNILVIMSDDVGYANIGLYSHGMMVPTPNIDRIGREGILFTDHYAHPSSTAGRAAFITGQLPIRTGLTTVGLPGSPIGIDGATRRWPRCSSRWATAPPSSARTTSATATTTCPRCTASTSFSATSTT